METILALFASGLSIVALSIWRAKRTQKYRALEDRMTYSFEASEQKASTTSVTAACYSRKWLIDNLVMRSHSRLGSALQQRLADNTLQAVILLGLALTVTTLATSAFFVFSIAAFGGAVLVFLAAMLVAVGPDEPRTSEALLAAVEKQGLQDLTREDYASVRLANASVTRWILVSLTVGFLFIVMAPFGDMLFQGIAAVVAFLTAYLILYPATAIADASLPLAFLYVALVASLIFYVFPKTLISALKGRREPESEES